MVVLNTGQKKMDYNHQLEILNDSVKTKLLELGIDFTTATQKAQNGPDKSKITLSAITEALVSYINKSPISGKKGAADFLFERFNIMLESGSENTMLKTIEDDSTYES